MTSLFQLFFFLIVVHVFCVSLHADILLKSWVSSANDPSSDFPIQNLPYGVFRPLNTPGQPRIGVAIGDFVLDLSACLKENCLGDLDRKTNSALKKELLNEFMSLNKQQQLLVRQKITALLEEGNTALQSDAQLRKTLLYPMSEVELLMPIQIGDYTDFYASLSHALHVGAMMRPDNPLMPNYKHMPIAYHGRSSSVVISGTPVNRPSGQIPNNEGIPQMLPSYSLDYELELGAVIGKGNQQGDPILLNEAKQHIFGFVLLNDWSARDIQKWEYQPLGPFNGKNFASTISPWVVTLEALQPFQVSSDQSGRSLLDYLASPNSSSFNIIVEAYLSSAKMREANFPPLLICKGNAKELYWTFEQMVCHHTISGCNLRPGDLLGSGTISGETSDSLGCLLERTAFKLDALDLPDGTSRRYLEDGDEIILRGYAEKDSYPRIGFGECRGIVK